MKLFPVISLSRFITCHWQRTLRTSGKCHESIRDGKQCPGENKYFRLEAITDYFVVDGSSVLKRKELLWNVSCGM